MPPELSSLSLLEVMPDEAGMKLLRFLERRLLGSPVKSLLHKWIRTGQIRVNGCRAKPFTALAMRDQVRIPPFALPRPIAADAIPRNPGLPGNRPATLAAAGTETPRNLLGADLPLLARPPGMLVLSKPAGLACQPGSGQQDSVSKRLAEAFSGRSFIPAPAHRLDRHTSGLVLAATSHAAQRTLHELFQSGGIRKDYLAWVAGSWPYAGPCLLLDRLKLARDARGRENMLAVPGGETLELPLQNASSLLNPHGEAGLALCVAMPLRQHSGSLPGLRKISRATLLLLSLLTGRKHQIRAQLASRAFPLIGDGRYGGPHFPQMLLHAHALLLPPVDTAASDSPLEEKQEYAVLPDWPGPLMPDLDAVLRARRFLGPITDGICAIAYAEPLCQSRSP